MGPICVDLVLVPICDVCVPLTALAVGSVEAARPPHLHLDPASDTVVMLTLRRAGAVVLGVDVTGPSHPLCPLVATIISLFGFHKLFSLLDQTAQDARYIMYCGEIDLFSPGS